MLKGFNELYALDVTNYVDKKRIGGTEIAYLNWAKCLVLLHQNGAETVYYIPLTNENGSYLFTSKETSDKDGRTHGCYFVKVEIHIDDCVFTMDYPLVNGTVAIKDENLDQLRISTAHARAFVKGVAIHTGLGLSLWTSDDDGALVDDLSWHRIDAIKERIQKTVTQKMQKGMSYEEVLSAVGLNGKMFEKLMSYLDTAAKAEEMLRAL